MTEVTQQAAQYLEEVFAATGLQLRVSVKSGVAGEVLDIEGKDSELLQAQTGELLEALQHLINQVFGRSLAGGARLVCDVNGFRATREAELQAMANLFARVQRDRPIDRGVCKQGSARETVTSGVSGAARHARCCYLDHDEGANQS